MMNAMRKTFFVAAASMLLLSACGGDNQAPIAVITADPSVGVGEGIVVSGIDSYDVDGTIQSYSWTMVSGEEVTTNQDSESVVEFVAPASPTTVTIELVVTDSGGKESRPASVSIDVNDPGSTGPSASQSASQAIFVSKSGSDHPSRDGSSAEPVATISRALELAQLRNYKTIYVMTGIYEEEISITSEVALRGCVTNVASDGTPVFTSDNLSTTIEAPSGSRQAVSVDGATGVSIECFTIEGGDTQPEAYGIYVDGSTGVSISDVNVSTPGSAGSNCRDIAVFNSSQVSIENGSFKNSGICDDYVAVDAEGSMEVDVGSDASSNDFAIEAGGVEAHLKAVSIVDSPVSQVVRSKIATVGGNLTAQAAFVAINAGDSQDIEIRDNEIDVDGSDALSGVLLVCTDSAFNAKVVDNKIDLRELQGDADGIALLCAQPSGIFDIERNLIYMEPADGAQARLSGIALSSLNRPVDVRLANNVVLLPVIGADAAEKDGVAMSLMGTQSTVDMRHNSFLVTGAQGEIHAVSTDDANAQFVSVNNVMFVFGGAAQNALFRMPSQCAVTFCAQALVNNLMDMNVGGNDLPLAFYYDTAQFESLNTANECEVLPAPPQCASKAVIREGNVLQLNMYPTNFDFTSGRLVPSQVALVKDAGYASSGVLDDIDGVPRTDGSPDIGAHEY